MEKPSGNFFSTLGYYIYWYSDGINPYYIGKGVGDRCWAHVIDKNFDPDHITIVAKDLSEEQALALESYLIYKHNPRENKVLGHHTERFVMAKLSEVFGTYQNEQYDNFVSLPEWYTENYDALFKGKVRELKISSESTFLLSSANQQMYMMFYWYPTRVEEPIKVTFEVNLPSGDKLEFTKDKLRQFLKKCGHKNTFDDGKPQKLALNIDSIDAVVKLWVDFWS